MSKPIKPGDLVYLKSGGPAMTVLSLISNKAYCGYFVETNYCEVVVTEEALEHAE